MTTLLLNGRVHSPVMPDATAMAVRDGVVAWLGGVVTAAWMETELWLPRSLWFLGLLARACRIVVSV